MKKGKLYISPIEREYVEKYKERYDITLIKLQEKKIPNDISQELVQLRMDNIFLRAKLEEKTRKLNGLEQCPF